MRFNAICENKILTKISEFTVYFITSKKPSLPFLKLKPRQYILSDVGFACYLNKMVVLLSNKTRECID